MVANGEGGRNGVGKEDRKGWDGGGGGGGDGREW